jgi:hypothetical protein
MCDKALPYLVPFLGSYAWCPSKIGVGNAKW